MALALSLIWHLLWMWKLDDLVRKTALVFQGHIHRLMTHLQFWPVWGTVNHCYGSVTSSATHNDRSFLPLSWQKLQNEFTATCFMPRLFVIICGTQVSGTSKSSSNFCTIIHQLLLIAASKHLIFLGVLLVKDLPDYRLLLADYQPSFQCLYHNFIWTSLIKSFPKAFIIIWIEKNVEVLSKTLQTCWFTLGHCEYDKSYSTHSHSTNLTANWIA